MKDRILIGTLAGDAAIIVIFALLGRGAHHETDGNALTGTIGVAAPVLAGLLPALFAAGAYSASAFRKPKVWIRRTAAGAAVGTAVALVIRSVALRRVAPLSFAIVAFLFLLTGLLFWRLLSLAAVSWRSPPPEGRHRL